MTDAMNKTQIASAPSSSSRTQAKTQETSRPRSSGVKKSTSAPTSVKAPAKTTRTAPQKPVVKKTAAAPAKPLKDKKVKVVRDSFTIPKNELLRISEMKKRALGLSVEIKKSELIRAGLQALASMPDASFKKALASVPTIKTGRPAKD